MSQDDQPDIVDAEVVRAGTVGTTPISEEELGRIEAALMKPLGPANEATLRAAYQAVPGFRRTILDLIAEVRRLRAQAGQ